MFYKVLTHFTQHLLQRRAELQRNKAKYALTETDAQLIGTHATEVRFEDGQTIVEENNDITNVYRVRSGKVTVSRFGFQFNIIGKVRKEIMISPFPFLLTYIGLVYW
jgi:CRP-like cAMP-binding protein